MPLLDLFAFILFLINAIVVPFIFAISFLAFIYGVAQAFIFNGGDEKKRGEGKKFAFWGIVGFFIMVSVWGLVNILVGTFGFGGHSRPPLPSFGSPGGFQMPGAPASGGQGCSAPLYECPTGETCRANFGSGQGTCVPVAAP